MGNRRESKRNWKGSESSSTRVERMRQSLERSFFVLNEGGECLEEDEGEG